MDDLHVYTLLHYLWESRKIHVHGWIASIDFIHSILLNKNMTQ